MDISEIENEQIRRLASEINSCTFNINEGSKRLEDLIRNGFPAGDLEGHRRYHQNVIEWQEIRNKMVREALIKAAGAGAIAGAGWIIYALWTAFIFSVTKGT